MHDIKQLVMDHVNELWCPIGLKAFSVLKEFSNQQEQVVYRKV